MKDRVYNNRPQSRRGLVNAISAASTNHAEFRLLDAAAMH